MSNGRILYRGPSMLDGAPIIVIATGFESCSANSKTGGMIQTWVMREDIAPHTALKTGDDSSVCGDCPHRPYNGGACYVLVHNAPRSVWAAYHRGNYPVATDNELQGFKLRIGSYGDPAAVPLHIWELHAGKAQSFTGYTHQWNSFPALAEFCMASCDSQSEQAHASLLGFRTFRVSAKGNVNPIAGREILCPASAEAGHKTTCDNCGLCAGTTSKARVSIMIPAHGGKASRFEEAA